MINKICKTSFVSLNIPEGVIFTDYVKRIKNDRCFHEEDYIHVGRVFTSGFSGRLASDKRKSREKRLSGSANFSGILIKFKPLKRVGHYFRPIRNRLRFSFDREIQHACYFLFSRETSAAFKTTWIIIEQTLFLFMFQEASHQINYLRNGLKPYARTRTVAFKKPKRFYFYEIPSVTESSTPLLFACCF